MPGSSASTKPLAEKLQMKAGRRVAILDAPSSFTKALGNIPSGIEMVEEPETADVVLIFVNNQKELDKALPRAKKMLAKDGFVWVNYPKLSSKLKGDINRDTIAADAKKQRLEGVAMVSIDDDWSALRLKQI